MTIAADISNLSQAKDPVFKAFITELLQRMAARNPGHHFVVITGRGFRDPFLTGNNIEQVKGGSAANRLLRGYWLNVRLPALLKKKGAAVYISTDGTYSTGAKIPQYILALPSCLLKEKKGSALKLLNKTDRVVGFSARQKEDISSTYGIPSGNIELVKGAASPRFVPLPYEAKKVIKDKYTAGKEYFIYTGLIGTDSNLLNLLKAFSLFKKRQQSGIRLLLAGETDQKDKEFVASLASYKYREEVVVTGSLDRSEKAGLVAAAYALIDPSLRVGPGLPALEAAACHVPVIAVTGQPLLEKEAFLEADTADPVDLAAQMMLLYKDENLCKRLIEKARASAKQYSLEDSAARLWELVTQTLQ